jgi:enoyl-CoA hydratase/carnithine racemase
MEERMEYKKIIFSVENGIARIILNSPKNLNAIDEPMVDEIMDALKIIEKSEDAKVVVLSGSGRSFSAGGDIRMMIRCIEGNNLRDLDGGILKVGMLSLALKKFSKPVIASVHGAVAGAGFNVALACDFIIAAENAKFIQAFVNIALVPDAGGVYLLTRAIGVNRTNELIMTGKPLSAEDAKDLGLVNNVVSEEELFSETENFAKKMTQGPSLAYQRMKELIFESEYLGFEKYLELEVKNQKLSGRTEDFKEGIISFAEKRRSEFQGR